MFKNYLKIAFRNLRRNKSYTFINILGLAIGLTCTLLIMMYVVQEFSYDRFHKNGDRIYRVIESNNSTDNETWYASTPSALAHAFTEEFSAVKKITHVYPMEGLITGPDNLKFQEEGIIYADSAFFDMFTFPLVSGNPELVLNRPMTMVITQTIASKFFGSSNPVGKTLTFKDRGRAFDFEVTGVAKNTLPNSHIKFDYVFSFESLKAIRSYEYATWHHPPMYTYVELESNESLGNLKSELRAFQQKYVPSEAHVRFLDLQPLFDIHLKSDLKNELSPTSSITYIYLFSAIGLFILIIACINFMNLGTARSMKRSREVGMRKTLGAQRQQLIGQFLGEAVIMTLISAVLAFFIVEIILPHFNSISGKSLSTEILTNWQPLTGLTAIILFVGLLSGSYPALYLSSFKPALVLKGSSRSDGRSASVFRKGLVVFQFFISTGLILGTLIVTQQLDYLQNERLGFNKEQVAVIAVREKADQFNVKSLKDEILRIPGVEKATAVSGVPGISTGIHDFGVVPEDNRQDTLSLMTITGDHSLVSTLEFNLIEGRDFSKEFGTDESNAFIINQTATKLLGWSEPIGKEMTLRFYAGKLIEKKAEVIGVVEDFQYHSLHENIDPILIHVFTSTYYHDYLAVRLNANNMSATLDEISKKWAVFNPDRPFEYTFLDETFDSMYRSELRLGMVFNSFAIIAILIACLGLFGLASYSTEQRLKELGIRRILGATVRDILSLLSKDFLKLVLIGFLISVPIVVFFMNKWLQNFADSIEIGFGLFFLVGIIAVAVTTIAVSYQTVRAALANPVQSLKGE